jgi:hypothetical protein
MSRTTRAENREYHYVYKTTCTVTGKHYYGMHSTDDLQDGYLGSGTILSRSVKKYGKENHTIEILDFVESRELLRLREQQIINDAALKDPMCMNLKLGGHGGFDHIQAHADYSAWTKAGRVKTNDILLEKGITQKDLAKMGSSVAKKEKTGVAYDPDFKLKYNFKYNREFQQAGNTVDARIKAVKSQKKKFAETKHQQGAKNSQYGTCWIHSLTEKKSMKVSKTDLEEHLALGWQAGRKIKF